MSITRTSSVPYSGRGHASQWRRVESPPVAARQSSQVAERPAAFRRSAARAAARPARSAGPCRSPSTKGEFAESASSDRQPRARPPRTRAGGSASGTETWTCSPQTSCRQIARAERLAPSARSAGSGTIAWSSPRGERVRCRRRRRASPCGGRALGDLRRAAVAARRARPCASGNDRRRQLDEALEELGLDAGRRASPTTRENPGADVERLRVDEEELLLDAERPGTLAEPCCHCRDAVHRPAGGLPGVVRGARPERPLVGDDARVAPDLLRALGVAEEVRVVPLLPDEDQVRGGHELGDERAAGGRTGNGRSRRRTSRCGRRRRRPSQSSSSSSSSRSSSSSSPQPRGSSVDTRSRVRLERAKAPRAGDRGPSSCEGPRAGGRGLRLKAPGGRGPSLADG